MPQSISGISILASNSVPGHFFDGTSSRRLDGEVQILGDQISLRVGERTTEFPVSHVRVVKRSGSLGWVLEFRDGSRFEALDSEGVLTRHFESAKSELWLHRLESSWKIVIGSTVAVIAVLTFTYFVGLPRIAKHVAPLIPRAAIELISVQSRLAIENAYLLGETKLPVERQAIARAAFQRVQEMVPGIPLKLSIKPGGKIGANAFVLPDGTTYLTDECVEALADENMLFAVLLHEAGHVVYHHSVQSLITTTGIGFLIFTIFGNVDIAAVPALLLSLGYSRENEFEADAFAAELLRKSGLDPVILADALDRMEKSHKADHSGIPSLLSSHPVTAERRARLTN